MGFSVSHVVWLLLLTEVKTDFQTLVRHCLDEAVCGKPLATILQPEAEDYFVLKPKHSAQAS